MQNLAKTIIPKLQKTPFYVPLMNRILHALLPVYAVNGIKLEAVDDRSVSASIPKNLFTKSHLGSVHAGPLYTLGEMLGGVLVMHRWGARGWVPIALKVCIEYQKLVKESARAETVLSEEYLVALEKEVEEKGKAVIDLEVKIYNEKGEQACLVTAKYLIRS